VRVLVIVVASILVSTLVGGCKTGGQYASGDRQAGASDRGETNGRTFEFVSYKPEGDDWQIRIRDDSMWVSYSSGEDSQDYGTKALTAKETEKVWGFIDDLELPDRKTGKKDEDEGYVLLRLREPGGDEGHDLLTVYVSRATEDTSVLDLGAYLGTLVTKYYKKEPEF
jgi:hypothetical protein